MRNGHPTTPPRWSPSWELAEVPADGSGDVRGGGERPMRGTFRGACGCLFSGVVVFVRVIIAETYRTDTKYYVGPSWGISSVQQFGSHPRVN